jgi:hypothetical protein
VNPFGCQLLEEFLYTTQKSVLTVLGFGERVEAVGYPDLGPPLLFARRDLFDEQPALSKRLFDFGYAFLERDESCAGCLGQLCLLAPLGEAGLQCLDQELQVIRLVLEAMAHGHTSCWVCG